MDAGVGNSKGNGRFECGFAEDINDKISETHYMIQTLTEHTSHLPKLTEIAESNERIEKTLLSSAIGKDHVGTPTVMLLLKIAGVVIFALTMIIVFLLTGARLGWVNILH